MGIEGCKVNQLSRSLAGVDMELDEKMEMITHSIGRAVINLGIEGGDITRQTISDRLDLYRKSKGNVIGQGLTEMLRNV